ncbi:MAG: hypothetical protein ACREV6_04375 [Clostridium sp.]|uniref:hypothetical protein n=1 Tax=Clostridium sp. TaxID=1506 RepID=UPI003D6CA664
MPDNNNTNKNNKNYYLSFGIGFGLLFGAGLGLIFKNIAMGVGFGMLIGIGIGGIMDKHTKSIKKDLIKIILITIIGVILILLTPKTINYLW